MTDRIWVDLNKQTGETRVALTADGTRRDLARLGIELREGLVLDFFMDDLDDAGVRDDLWFTGVVTYDAETWGGTWVADWAGYGIGRASDHAGPAGA